MERAVAQQVAKHAKEVASIPAPSCPIESFLSSHGHVATGLVEDLLLLRDRFVDDALDIDCRSPERSSAFPGKALDRKQIVNEVAGLVRRSGNPVHHECPFGGGGVIAVALAPDDVVRHHLDRGVGRAKIVRRHRDQLVGAFLHVGRDARCSLRAPASAREHLPLTEDGVACQIFRTSSGRAKSRTGTRARNTTKRSLHRIDPVVSRGDYRKVMDGVFCTTNDYRKIAAFLKYARPLRRLSPTP
jgi:hypothetical protein